MTVIITSVEDAYWPGAGPTKRIKGSFSGKLASVEGDRQGNVHVAGPLKQVEGKFDLYTFMG